MEMVIFMIGAIGFFAGPILWLVAIRERTDDTPLFEAYSTFRIKRKWVTPKGYKMYITSQILFAVGIVSLCIFWIFMVNK